MKFTNKQKLIYVGPVIIFLLAFSIFPLVYALRISFTDLNIARANTGKFIGLENYISLFKPKGMFLKSLKNTTLLVVGTLIAEMLTGFIMAKLFYSIRDKPSFSLLRTLYMLPIMITPMVFGIIWTYILNPTQGVMNYLLSLINLPQGTWLGSNRTALVTIMLIDWWQFTPLVTIILLSGLFTIDSDLYDASSVDGANWLQTVLYVDIPNISQLIGIAAILRVIDIIKMFDLVYVSTRGGPGGATEVIGLFSYRQAFEYYNIGLGVASSVLTMVLIVLLSKIFSKYAISNE